jgi:hypothetical protein
MKNYNEVLLEILNEDNIDDAIELLIYYLSTFEAS